MLDLETPPPFRMQQLSSESNVLQKLGNSSGETHQAGSSSTASSGCESPKHIQPSPSIPQQKTIAMFAYQENITSDQVQPSLFSEPTAQSTTSPNRNNLHMVDLETPPSFRMQQLSSQSNVLQKLDHLEKLVLQGNSPGETNQAGSSSAASSGYDSPKHIQHSPPHQKTTTMSAFHKKHISSPSTAFFIPRIHCTVHNKSN